MDTESKEQVYKKLSHDMRNGLKDIYQQISTASKNDSQFTESSTHELFREASMQLDEVLKATEEATTNILEIIERNEEKLEEVSALLSSLPDTEKRDRLQSIIEQLGEDFTSLTLQLSFQDLTGQRIKRVVSALNRIEDSVVNLYITSGLIMEGAENNPNKDASSLKEEAEQAVKDFREQRKKAEQKSELKGPDANGISQSAIDNMLAQLGM
ncbi:MAG: protein phosphatase CheZ [Desulfovibrionaceae bacterium]|nr:protein phosphatase CheZ [Desulfovibrionaceae bacterium]